MMHKAPRSVRRMALLLGIPLLLLGGVAWAFSDFIFHRYGAVAPDVLYRSALLNESMLEDKVQEDGIRTIVNFTHQQEADLAVAEREGLNYVWLHTTQVPSEDVVQSFLEIMDDPANHPVLIHCEHGSGRTGVMAALYRMEFEGWEADEAVREARHWSHYGSFQPDQDKTLYLKSYEVRSAAP